MRGFDAPGNRAYDMGEVAPRAMDGKIFRLSPNVVSFFCVDSLGTGITAQSIVCAFSVLFGTENSVKTGDKGYLILLLNCANLHMFALEHRLS